MTDPFLHIMTDEEIEKEIDELEGPAATFEDSVAGLLYKDEEEYKKACEKDYDYDFDVDKVVADLIGDDTYTKEDNSHD